MKKAKTVSEYLSSVPLPTKKALNDLRKIVKGLAPKATEVISYGIPTFKEGRMLVAYAAFTKHCSFFPLSASILEEFRNELSGYETSRGTIRFTVEHPLPSSLVKKIVRARIRQNRERDLRKGVSPKGR